jgi:ABC-type polysaccharide/polyol phosphate transport system ATPase subunit
VTHDSHLVLNECTRAVWIRDKRIVADGEPAHVLGAYHYFLSGRDMTGALVAT